MEEIETILTNCIKEIKSGKATLSECLESFPLKRHELEPLLKMALNIQKPPAFELDHSYKKAAKARLLQQIRASKQKKSRSFADIFSFGIPPKYAWARVAVSVLAVLVLLSTLTGGTTHAAQSSLPGELLYPVKKSTEDVRLFLAGNSAMKAELNLEFAYTRLVEMSKLATKDGGKTALAVNGYQGNLDAAQQQIRGISDDSALSNVLNSAMNDIQNQMIFCDEIIDTNPTYIKPVREASTLSVNEQIELLELLAQQDNLQAAQINLNAMQNRLQRAQEKANGNQYQLMQEVLLQYQQFNQLGEQILKSAQASNQHNTEIEELSLQALSGYLDTLDSIYQQVPQQYRNSIEICQQMTLQLQNQARHQYQKQGNPDMNLESSASKNSNGSTTGQGGQTTSQYQGRIDNLNNDSPNATTTPDQGIGGSSGSSSGGNASGSGGTGSGGGTNPD